ncbi:hypothetical protein LTR72_001278 [Exophiala xenobiotica]|nr:hypothetical protein LTR72_001278 [Exophiala xenobiotica]KAK5492126.1 hypothetical protein LTR55_003478 [Exophiala xenobiotica]
MDPTDSGNGSRFHFISIQNPTDAKDRDKRRLARSHAIKHSMQSRRKHLQTSTSHASEASAQTLVPWSVFAPESAYGHFETLFGDSPKLSTLLSHGKFCNNLRDAFSRFGAYNKHADLAKQAVEPVFSIADPVIFQDFDSVFRNDLDDPALLSAIKLSFAFAVTGGNIDHECLHYQNEAMSTIRERMNSPDTALGLPTLGAILLLAGVEASQFTYSPPDVFRLGAGTLELIRRHDSRLA